MARRRDPDTGEKERRGRRRQRKRRGVVKTSRRKFWKLDEDGVQLLVDFGVGGMIEHLNECLGRDPGELKEVSPVSMARCRFCKANQVAYYRYENISVVMCFNCGEMEDISGEVKFEVTPEMPENPLDEAKRIVKEAGETLNKLNAAPAEPPADDPDDPDELDDLDELDVLFEDEGE